MNHTESYIKSHDHHRLYYQVYKPSSYSSVLLFIHGLNEHSGRYGNPVNYFTKKNHAVYLFDRRGHGKSDGLRSYVDNLEEYLKDMNEFLKFVVTHEKKKPIFMVGHSMGGQLVINFASQYQNILKGLVISSANIETAIKIPWLKKTLGFQASRFLPKLTLKNQIDIKLISRDKKVVEAYKQDPLVSKTLTLRLAASLLKNQEEMFSLAKKIKLPVLLLHGEDDKICAASGTKKFYKNLSSTDKTLKLYKGAYHELFNELNKDEVFEDMQNWFKKQLEC